MNVLVTAGPTREYLDPVRYISNRSSGKTGYTIAEVFAGRGAKVKLISGPVCLNEPKNIELINVVTSKQMEEATLAQSDWADVIIMCAAVVDYKPQNYSEEKIKKTENNISLELVKNTDILAKLGSNKKEGQFLVGFSLETQNLRLNAEEKLEKKNLDIIIANSINAINSEKAKFIIIDKYSAKTLANATKQELAEEIASRLLG